MNKQRGGARPGSGRKKAIEARRTHGVRLNRLEIRKFKYVGGAKWLRGKLRKITIKE